MPGPVRTRDHRSRFVDLLQPAPSSPPPLPLQDMFKKEHGRYARFVAASLCAMRYQCRMGIIAAGDQGCPQVLG